jgi:hypothetical protein
VPDLTALVQSRRWSMLGAAFPPVNSCDGCHGCSSHIGSNHISSGQVRSGHTNLKNIRHLSIFFLFLATIFCKIGSIFINTAMAYLHRFLFLPPLKLNLSVYLRPCAIFCAWAFFGTFFNAFYFDAFYWQKCYQDNLISGV